MCEARHRETQHNPFLWGREMLRLDGRSPKKPSGDCAMPQRRNRKEGGELEALAVVCARLLLLLEKEEGLVRGGGGGEVRRSNTSASSSSSSRSSHRHTPCMGSMHLTNHTSTSPLRHRHNFLRFKGDTWRSAWFAQRVVRRESAAAPALPFEFVGLFRRRRTWVW